MWVCQSGVTVLRLICTCPGIQSVRCKRAGERPVRIAARLGEQLLEMIDLRIDLEPWDELDTIGYLQLALVEAGCQQPLFDDDSLSEIHRLAAGIPRRVNRLADYALPEIAACIEANLGAARLTNPGARFVGIALDTSAMERQVVAALVSDLEDVHGLPCVDPMAMGVGPIVDRLA